MRLTAVAVLAVAALSLLIPAAPGYDAWAWLAWGREVASLDLSTVDGPAFKPLPVAVCALLAPFGGAAPELWLVVARAGALAALVMAFVVARSLGGVAAGLVAAVAVALTGGFFLRAAVGDTEPMMVALALGALHRGRAGAHGHTLALAAAAALLRPEAWPFLGLYGIWLWRSHARLRAPLALLAAAIPAAWFVPEWLGSGELLRSTDRALVPNPGQPALADFPAGESLWRALGLLFAPAAAAVLLLRSGPGMLVAAAGAAWLLLVAVMAQAGFSGEERYAFPGAALIAVAGASALVRWPRLAVVAVAAFGALRVADVIELRPRLAYSHDLARALPPAIEAAGGRQAVLACGRPAVGRFRGTVLAYHLRVEKRRVRADGEPDAATFRSRLTADAPLSPGSGGRLLAANPHWRIECAHGGFRPRRSVTRTSTITGTSPTATISRAGNAAVW